MYSAQSHEPAVRAAYKLEGEAAAAARASGGPGGSPGRGGGGGGGGGGAAAAASWRQWLLHDVSVVALLELGLRLLAALPPRDPHAVGVVLSVRNTLLVLPLAAPDALAPRLPRLPLPPPGSPWRSDTLRGVLLKYMPTLATAGLPAGMLAAAAARRNSGSSWRCGMYGAQLHAASCGGPATRVALSHMTAMPAGDGACLAGPAFALEAVEAVVLEASLAALQPLGKQQQERPQQQRSAGPVLLCCANPRCTNLAGQSEAALPLSACGGCKAVRLPYCCVACQSAHWRAGHKEACDALKAAGGGAARGGAARGAAAATG